MQKTAKARSIGKGTKATNGKAARYTRKPAAPASPASDRIRAVQLALAERGFLASEPTGVWNADSIDALKRFETAQQVRADGKLDSKMLIALGLGPKYDANLALPVPAAGGGSVVAAEDASRFDALPRIN